MDDKKTAEAPTLKCPRCGLEAPGLRCPRCNAVKVEGCGGSCKGCKLGCAMRGKA